MTFVLVFIFFAVFDYTSAVTNPKITIKSFKNNDNFRYAVISGSKYKNANKKMADYVAYIYSQNKAWKKESQRYQDQGIQEPEYFSYLSCKVKYNHNNKISITCENDYLYGTNHSEKQMKVFNFYSGKSVSLKNAFKSSKDYVAANKYVKSYIAKNKNKYPLATKDTEMYHHDFYWTSTSIKVVYNPYELAGFAHGIITISVPKKYVKY